MKQVTRSLLTLGLVAAVGGALALIAYQRAGEVVADPAATTARSLVDASPSDISSIEVTILGNRSRVERSVEGWRVTAPVVIGADEAEVDKLVKGLTTLKARTEFGTAENPDVPADGLTGLAAPEVVVELVVGVGEGAKRVGIEVGARSDYNREHYARVTSPDGEVAVVTISPSAANNARKGWTDLRDRRVIGANAERIVKLRVVPKKPSPGRLVFEVHRLAPDPTLPLYRQSERFVAVEPDFGPADAGTVKTLIKGLARGATDELLTVDHGGKLAEHGLAEPAWTVKLWLTPFGAGPAGDAALIERTIFISAEEDGAVRIARADQTWVGKTTAAVVENLEVDAVRLESKRLFDFDRARVTRLEMTLEAAGHIVAEKQKSPSGDGRWALLAPEPSRAKAHRISALILGFTTLVGQERVARGDEVSSAATRKKYGLDEPQSISFFEGERELGVLWLGKRDGELGYAMAKDGQFIVSIVGKHFDELPLSAAELVDTR